MKGGEMQEEEKRKEEKQEDWESFEEKQTRLYERGRKLVYLIAGVNIVCTVISFFMDYNLISFCINIALAIALMCGVTWVRYFYVVTGAINVLLLVMILFQADYSNASISGLPWLSVLYSVVSIGYLVAVPVVLLKSKSVEEFMYRRRNGG